MRTGRPRAEIDPKQFEKLCALQCTHEEICSWFDISPKTLEAFCKRTYGTTFSKVFAQKRGIGKISLRRAQFKLAENNANMAIWLGKQYLDQSDKPKESTGSEESTPVDELSAALMEYTKNESESDKS